jgi:chemotaxis protein CheD
MSSALKLDNSAAAAALPDRGRRLKDTESGLWSRRVLAGEFYVTGENEIISTVLGSCVSVCMRDPQAGVGGMNHFMLPDEGNRVSSATVDTGLSTRFGSHAMESLINGLMVRGAVRNRLEIKIFGGAQILDSHVHIGEQNIRFVRNFLAVEGLRPIAEDLGDVVPRSVLYYPMTGRVRVKHLKPVESKVIAREEFAYLGEIAKRGNDGGEVELFD